MTEGRKLYRYWSWIEHLEVERTRSVARVPQRCANAQQLGTEHESGACFDSDQEAGLGNITVFAPPLWILACRTLRD
jgi:hypothetical protein